MRKKGSTTLKLCWKCEVINQNEIVFQNEYATLKQVANELGLTYSQVVELSSGRKKDNKGRYDTNYRFTRIINSAGKLNEMIDEVKEDSDDEINPSMNGMSS